MTQQARLAALEALEAFARFVDDMRRLQIHVGISTGPNNPVCAACGEPWPCTGEGGNP